VTIVLLRRVAPSMPRAVGAMLALGIVFLALASPARARSAAHAPAVGDAAPQRLNVASDGMHAWIAVERPAASGTGFVVLHHAATMGVARAREAFVLGSRPEAMVAHDGQLWLVLAPSGPGARRDVCTVRTLRNPVTGGWYSLPAGPLTLLPSLPGEGSVRGMAVDGERVIVLGAGGGLQELGPRGWRPMPSPDGAELGPGHALAMVGGQPTILGVEGRIVRLEPDGAWRPAPWQLPEGASIEPVPGASRPAVLRRGRGTWGGSDADAATRAWPWSIEYLRAGPALPLAPFESPDRAWAVVGLGDGFLMVLATGEGGAAVRAMDPTTGAMGAAEVLEPQVVSAGGWVALATIVMAALGVGTALALRRSLGVKRDPSERR
jgi:hypothetical protein